MAMLRPSNNAWGKKVNTSDSDLSFKMGLVSQAEATSFY